MSDRRPADPVTEGCVNAVAEHARVNGLAGASSVELVRRRFFAVYGAHLTEGDRDAGRPGAQGVHGASGDAEAAERVHGSRIDPAIPRHAPLDLAGEARVARDGAYVDGRSAPMGLAWQRESYLAVPQGIADAAIFHELCHLYTSRAYRDWQRDIPRSRGFMEAHTEALTRIAMRTRSGSDHDRMVDRLLSFGVPIDVLSGGMFGGRVRDLERALLEASQEPDMASFCLRLNHAANAPDPEGDH